MKTHRLTPIFLVFMVLLLPATLLAINQARVQLSVPFPDPVKAGENLTFQIVVLNVGTETWTPARYVLYIEIYDEDKNYITKTESLVGNVSIGPGGTALFYLPYKTPADDYDGMHFYRIVLDVEDTRIFYSEHLNFAVISTVAKPSGPPPLRVRGKGMLSYKNGTENIWQDHFLNLNLGVIGIAFENPVTFKFDSSYTMRSLKLNTILLNYRLPSVNISAGDVMPAFSTFAFSNMGVRGILVDGEIEKTKITGVAALSVSAQQSTDTSPGVFARYVYGIRGGITPLKDLKLGLSCVYTNDDRGSVSNPGTGLTAAKNLVGAGDIAYLINKKYLVDLEYSYSNYTSDMVNNPGGDNDSAYSVLFSGVFGKFATGVSYKYVGTYFNSLNSPFSAKDRAGAEGLLNYELDFIKVYFLYGRSNDNLHNDSSKITTTYDRLSATATLNFSRFPVFTIGYGLNSFMGNRLDLVNNITNNASLGISHKIWETSISLGYQISDFSDRTLLSPSLSSRTFNLRVTRMLGKRLSFNSGINYSILQNFSVPKTEDVIGMSLGANYKFIPEKLTLSGFGSFSRKTDNIATTDNIYSNISFEGTYNITKEVALTTGLELIDYTDWKNSLNNYQNWRIGTRIGYSF